jgi:adenylate kinase family enzyme
MYSHPLYKQMEDATEVAIETINKPNRRLLRLISILGPTCAGKSTLINTLRTLDSGKGPRRIGFIEVGKILRAKYSPEHFQGQAAPQHTQLEAWTLFLDSLVQYTLEGYDAVVVDGQPRSVDQAHMILNIAFNGNVNYHAIYLTAPLDVRQARCAARDISPEAKKLTEERLVGDCIPLCDVLAVLGAGGASITLHNTHHQAYTPERAAEELRAIF